MTDRRTARDDGGRPEMNRRVFVRSAAIFGTAAIVSPAFLTACASSGTSTSSKPKTGGTLRIGTIGGFSALDPALWVSGADTFPMFSIMEGLVSRKPSSMSSINTLATSLQPSSDGRTISFELKPGIAFHKNYGELTAADVKASFERTAGLLKTQSYYAGDWTNLKAVEVTGSHSGVLHFSKPFAPLMTTTLPLLSGLVVSGKALKELGGKKFGQAPVGTGPYELDSMVPGQRVVLKRFNDYSGANSDAGVKAAYDEIDFVSFKDPSALALALQSGDIDYGGPIDLSDVHKFTGGQQTAHSYSGGGVGWVGMNMRSPKLQDNNVRKAIRYAVDPKTIIDGAYEGQWELASCPVPDQVLGHWADAPTYSQDLGQASGLLGAAAAAPTTLKLTVATENQAAAQIVQASLKQVGINAQLDVVDRGSFYDPAAQKTWDIFFHSWECEPDPDWFLEWFTSDQLGGGYNLMGYSNKEYDKLRIQGVETLDATERSKIYVRMQQLLDESICAVWVGFTVGVYVSAEGLKVAVSPDGQTQQMWAFQA